MGIIPENQIFNIYIYLDSCILLKTYLIDALTRV